MLCVIWHLNGVRPWRNPKLSESQINATSRRWTSGSPLLLAGQGHLGLSGCQWSSVKSPLPCAFPWLHVDGGGQPAVKHRKVINVTSSIKRRCCFIRCQVSVLRRHRLISKPRHWRAFRVNLLHDLVQAQEKGFALCWMDKLYLVN